MHASKSIGWVVGISAIAITTATAPAIAIPNNSDTSGTNTTGQVDLLYGFEALQNKPEIQAILQKVLKTINKIISYNRQAQAVPTIELDAATAVESFAAQVGKERQHFSSNRLFDLPLPRRLDAKAVSRTDRQISEQERTTDSYSLSNSASISSETKEALSTLTQHLQDMERGLWSYGNDLDKALAASAQGLLKDLNAANKACQTNPSNCAQFSELFADASNFVQDLKALETVLQNKVQKARIY